MQVYRYDYNDFAIYNDRLQDEPYEANVQIYVDVVNRSVDKVVMTVDGTEEFITMSDDLFIRMFPEGMHLVTDAIEEAAKQ